MAGMRSNNFCQSVRHVVGGRSQSCEQDGADALCERHNAAHLCACITPNIREGNMSAM
jgi:hypothetical protein